MAVTPTAWHQNNRGLYVRMQTSETNTFAIDLVNELSTSDALSTVTATVDSGITLLSAVPRRDVDISATPHQMLVVLRATQTGVFHIKLTGTTTQGLTHVKHFDVLVER